MDARDQASVNGEATDLKTTRFRMGQIIAPRLFTIDSAGIFYHREREGREREREREREIERERERESRPYSACHLVKMRLRCALYIYFITFTF